MTKTLSMVSQQNYNLNANEDFVIFFTSKLITCFIDGFTSKMKSQSIAYLLNESEHIYWILDLEGEMHSIWDLWRSGLQECKSNGFFEVGRGGQKFSVGSKKSRFLCGVAALARIYLPQKACRREDIVLTITHVTLNAITCSTTIRTPPFLNTWYPNFSKSWSHGYLFRDLFYLEVISKHIALHYYRSFSATSKIVLELKMVTIL